MHADSEVTFIRDYKVIARKFGLDKTLDGEDLLIAVRHEIEAEALWVLIVDNADDLELFGVPPATGNRVVEDVLYKYIPIGPSGTVLWTSRDEHIVDSLVPPGRGIEVTAMTPAEATMLLETTRNRKASAEELGDVKKLLKELQYFPLAILQAGAYMRRMSTTAEAYLSLLGQSKRRWEALGANVWNRYRRPDIPNSVLETWLVTIQQIRNENQMAYTILHVIAYLDNQLPHELMLAIGSYSSMDSDHQPEESDIVSAIMRLKEFSFLKMRQVDRDERNYEMHKLVQEATRHRLKVRDLENQMDGESPEQATSTQTEQTSEAYYSGLALGVVAGLFPESGRESWEQCEKYFAHAIRVWDWVEIFKEPLWTTVPLFSRVSNYLFDQGRWREKEAVDRNLYGLAQKELGEKHPDTIRSMTNLAVSYSGQGCHDKARALNEEALRLWREVYGENNPETIRCMSKLGGVYCELGQYAEAEALLKHVLDYQHRILGERHADTLRTMTRLAATYQRQGLFDESEALKEKALYLEREVLGEKHADTITGMIGLASVYHRQGRYAESAALKEEAIKLQQEVFGEKHPTTIKYMTSLATTYYKMGRYDEDESICIRVLELQREALGENHPQTIECMHDLAITLNSRGRHEEALALIRDCVERGHSIPDADDAFTRRCEQILQKWESKKKAMDAQKIASESKGKPFKSIRKWFKGNK